MESDIELENERDPDQIKEEEEADDQELVIIPVAVKETCSEYSTKDGCKVIPVRKSNDSKVMCELCCDILKSSASLERHIKRRHGHVAFTCEECGKQTDSLLKLRKHQRCHRTLHCKKCDKKISTINKAKHSKLCKGKKVRSKCSMCEYSTTSTFKMEKHKHREHPMPVSKPVKEPHKCQYCDKVFSRKFARDLHEAKNCRLRNLQLDTLTPLTEEEALDWFSSTNMTKKDFDIIISKLEQKFGDNIIQRGTKVTLFIRGNKLVVLLLSTSCNSCLQMIKFSL